MTDTAEFVVRDVVAPDLSTLTRINNDSVPAVGEADEAKLAHIVSQSVVALSVDRTDEPAVPVGFCLVLAPGADYSSVNYRWFEEHYDDFVYLDRVAIDEPARNRGLGALLYAEVERRVDAALFTLEVNLRPRNDGSLRFHHRLGFAEVGQLETDYGVLVSLLAKPLR